MWSSIKQIDEQISDVKYLMDAAGFGQMMFFVDAMIKPYTSGIDGKKDAGLMLFFADDSPMPDDGWFSTGHQHGCYSRHRLSDGGNR